MNRYNCKYCPPPKRKPKKKCNDRKLGIIMLGLGAITVMALFLPLKYWVLLLSISLIVFGIILLRSKK